MFVTPMAPLSPHAGDLWHLTAEHKDAPGCHHQRANCFLKEISPVNERKILFTASLAHRNFALSATLSPSNRSRQNPPQCLPCHVPGSLSANAMKMLNSRSMIPLKNSDLLKRQQLHSGRKKSSCGKKPAMYSRL